MIASHILSIFKTILSGQDNYMTKSMFIFNNLLRRPVALLVSQASLVFQEIPAELASPGHLVLLARKANLGREEMIT